MLLYMYIVSGVKHPKPNIEHHCLNFIFKSKFLKKEAFHVPTEAVDFISGQTLME